MVEKIRKGFIAVVWLVLIGAVAIAIYTRNDQPVQPAPAVMARATEQPSETPTPSPVPTIDTYPTYQLLEIDRMRAEADLQAINLQIAQTEQNIAQAKADEAAALASIADSEAKKAEQLRMTTETQNEQIKLKIELQRLENERTAIQNEQNAIMAIQAKADAQSGANWGLFVGGGLIAGAIVFAGLKISAMPPAEKPKNTETRSENSRPLVAHITEDNQITRIPPPPCSDEAFREWASRCLSGDSAAIDHWETKESPFAGYDYRKVFYPWAVKFGLLAHDASGRRVLSNRGEVYCQEWLFLHPPLPQDENAPKTAPLPSVDTETVGTEAVGEIGKDEG